jgi:hypothetical protein
MVAFQRGRALCGALALAFACATGAQAQTYNITSAGWTSNPGWVIGPVDYPTLGTHGEEEARIGPALLKGTDGSGNPVSLLTWCIDLFDPLQPGVFNATDIGHSGFDATRLTQIATFLEHAQPLAVDANSAAAVQLGVWEILYEDTGSWNAASGTFYSPRLPAVSGLANTWLADLASNDWQPDPTLRLEVLVPEGINQAQVRLVPASQHIGGVPEPATWGMMLIGFGLAGMGMRRRRRTQIVFS